MLDKPNLKTYNKTVVGMTTVGVTTVIYYILPILVFQIGRMNGFLMVLAYLYFAVALMLIYGTFLQKKEIINYQNATPESSFDTEFGKIKRFIANFSTAPDQIICSAFHGYNSVYAESKINTYNEHGTRTIHAIKKDTPAFLTDEHNRTKAFVPTALIDFPDMLVAEKKTSDLSPYKDRIPKDLLNSNKTRIVHELLLPTETKVDLLGRVFEVDENIKFSDFISEKMQSSAPSDEAVITKIAQQWEAFKKMMDTNGDSKNKLLVVLPIDNYPSLILRWPGYTKIKSKARQLLPTILLFLFNILILGLFIF